MWLLGLLGLFFLVIGAVLYVHVLSFDTLEVAVSIRVLGYNRRRIRPVPPPRPT